MFNNWWNNKNKKIGFEDMKICIENTTKNIIINTLPIDQQDCLIKNTISIQEEEKRVNSMMENYDMKGHRLIIYGRNSVDDSVETKYKQLTGLGFAEVYIYSGGLFEWLLLQDIYGEDEFPTTKKSLDILKYRPNKMLA